MVVQGQLNKSHTFSDKYVTNSNVFVLFVSIARSFNMSLHKFSSGADGLEQIKKELNEYAYVRFTLIDVVGIPRAKLVPARHAYDFMVSGIPFYGGTAALGSNCELGYPKEVTDNNYDNVKLFPALETFHEVTWLSGGKNRTAEVFVAPGESTQMDKGFRSCYSRVVACEQVRKLTDLGYTVKSGTEWEYMLLNKEDGTPVFNTHIDQYSTLLLAEFEDWFVDVEKKLYAAGVDLQTMHTEYAFGQFEFNPMPETGIKSADGNVVFKQCVKEMATLKGWQANFMAKLSPTDEGSGAHFNHSLWDINTGANAFYDALGTNGLSCMAEHWIAGLIKHAPALTALCCPTTNCYQRLHKPWTPGYNNWGIGDRMATIRVKNGGPISSYVENRIPSSLANPYLVLAGTLAAGMDGMKNKLTCPKPNEQVTRLPYSLEEALECLEKDVEMVEALGKPLVNWFVSIKRGADLKAIEGITDEKERYMIERKNYGRTC